MKTIYQDMKKRKQKARYNKDILNQLIKRYGYSQSYIEKSLRGDRTGIMPDILKKEYNKMDNASKTALKSTLHKLI